MLNPTAPMPADGPDQRTLEILDRVKAVFAQKGFDGASMQDLARAAGMSAGNFYRYFPSKDAIIAGLVERELAMIETEFARVMQSADPREELLATIRRRIGSVCLSDGLLWTEIEAGATRKPEIGALHARMETHICTHMVAVFARIAGIAPAEAAARFTTHAGALMMLVHGVATRSCMAGSGPAKADLVSLVMRMVEGLLAEVAAGRAPLSEAHLGERSA